MRMEPIDVAEMAPRRFRGRSNECAVLHRLMDDARGGHGSVLVVRGEAGVGKTTLLDYAAREAAGFRLAQIAGVESEMELAYAGLHQLCAPMLGQLGTLRRPQADALEVAFGLTTGSPPDRFLVSLATFSLVAASALDRPLLCVVDDSQWLDHGSLQVLGFVARRLLAERVALVFAVRDPGDRRELTRLPQLRVDGLAPPDARALLASELAGPIDPAVRDRIINEARGNPLALLELARGSAPADFAGGFAMPDEAATSRSVERTMHSRLEGLPPDTRRLVVLAAAEPVGEPGLVWRGAEHLGIPREAAWPATDVGLIEFVPKVRFRHPLVRSAAYRSASLRERQAAHGALARAIDPELEPDRRAWHLALATIEPVEQIAAEVERSAPRAGRRGGLAAAAAFLERAAVLTPDRPDRARRLLAAADAKREAGGLDAAARLLSDIEIDTLDELARARCDALQGRIAFDQRKGREASRSLAAAARRLEPLALGVGRRAHLEALSAAMWTGERLGPGGIQEIARAALAAPQPTQDPDMMDVLLDGLARRFVHGYQAAAETMSRALEMALRVVTPPDDSDQQLWTTVPDSTITVTHELWDAEAWHTLAGRRKQSAHEAGALVQLQFAAHSLAWSHILGGQLEAAAQLAEENRTLAAVTGNQPLVRTNILLAAFRGENTQATRLIDDTVRDATASGLTRGVVFARYASAVLNNALGRHAFALDAVSYAFEGDHAGYGPFVVPELAEAAARTGDAAVLASAHRWIIKRTCAMPTDWSLGIEARIRALQSDGSDADAHYRQSVEHLRRTRVRTELARTHLLYGEWLRRQHRRVDAREQLSVAHDMLEVMGLAAFAARARRELAATGATARRRVVETRDDLTPQERQIARLARDGLSNPEIGAQLFLSPRTVEWHLRKVFAKLGIASRKELSEALCEDRRAIRGEHDGVSCSM